MKVTRKQLFKQLIPFFEEMGYIYFKDTISAANGLFAKKIDDCIYLSVGINTSNLFENSFNCYFYIGRSLEFGFTYPDTRDAYVAITQLMTEKELDKYRGEGTLSDVHWWHSDDINSINSCKECVQLTEQRLLTNVELRSRIVSNEEAKHQYELSTRVQMFVKNGMPAIETQFVPEKEMDGIPLIWFVAADYVQREEKYYNKNSVFALAADAYRRFVLDKKSM